MQNHQTKTKRHRKQHKKVPPMLQTHISDCVSFFQPQVHCLWLLLSLSSSVSFYLVSCFRLAYYLLCALLANTYFAFCVRVLSDLVLLLVGLVSVGCGRVDCWPFLVSCLRNFLMLRLTYHRVFVLAVLAVFRSGCFCCASPRPRCNNILLLLSFGFLVLRCKNVSLLFSLLFRWLLFLFHGYCCDRCCRPSFRFCCACAENSSRHARKPRRRHHWNSRHQPSNMSTSSSTNSFSWTR